MNIIDEGKLAHLYRYCRSRGVRYYDVQTELVDHLAEAIEKLGSNWKNRMPDPKRPLLSLKRTSVFRVIMAFSFSRLYAR
jgi:hypothetical protein